MRIGPIGIIWSPPGETSVKGCWWCFHDIYSYSGDNLWYLLKDMFKNWKKDTHLSM
jgi:hypothetical protein